MPEPAGTAAARRRIGFIGLGLMGAPMAGRLVAAGHAVTVWNRTADKIRPLAALGAEAAESPSACARDAEILITMLERGSVVGHVLFERGAGTALAPGGVVIDMSSIAPAETVDHAARLARRGVAHIDAPVSGGTIGAGEGSLAIMAGGDRAVFDAVRPVLAALGRPTHVGPCGSGQVAKLANQMIVAATIGVVAEALVFAARAGADPASVRNALRGGFAESRILEQHGARMISRDFAPGGRTSSQIKDLENAVSAAADVGASTPFAETCLDLFRDLIRSHGDVDHSGLWLTLDPRSRRA